MFHARGVYTAAWGEGRMKGDYEAQYFGGFILSSKRMLQTALHSLIVVGFIKSADLLLSTRAGHMMCAPPFQQ